MKYTIIFSLFFSFYAHSEALFLDAACKAECLVSYKQQDYDQGSIHEIPIYKTIYFDLINLTREEMDKATSSNNICTPSPLHKIDCLYFKH